MNISASEKQAFREYAEGRTKHGLIDVIRAFNPGNELLDALARHTRECYKDGESRYHALEARLHDQSLAAEVLVDFDRMQVLSLRWGAFHYDPYSNPYEGRPQEDRFVNCILTHLKPNGEVRDVYIPMMRERYDHLAAQFKEYQEKTPDRCKHVRVFTQ